MPTISRVRTAWNGFPGSPGVTTMYCQSPATFIPNLHAFWTALRVLLPLDVNLQIESTGDQIDTASGDVVGLWSESGLSPIAGSSAREYSAPTGICINWHTGTYMHGRELRGRTFVVPAANNVYDSSGSVASVTRDSIDSLCAVLIAADAPSLLVYHGPRPGEGGGSAAASVGRCSPQPAVMRSRRP